MASIKEFIISTAEKFFHHKNDVEINGDDEILQTFINEPQVLTLCIIKRENKLEFQKEVSYENEGCLIFYKSKQISLENENSQMYIGITALPENPIESLYLSLRHIYGPLLQAGNFFGMDPKIQETIMYLEGSLRTIAHGRDGGPSLLVLLTVDDELQYWMKIYEETKVYKQREMAESFVSILKLLSQEMAYMDNHEANDVKEAMENSSGLLDDLWRHSSFLYPQKRMIHLMDIIGNTCLKKLQDILTDVNIWSDESNIMTITTDCMEAASAWLKACFTLTKKYWPNHSLHVWEGPPHCPVPLQKFHDRLKEVMGMKSVHSQLKKLLSNTEQKDLNINEMFSPFGNVNIWNFTSQNESSWSKSKSLFEKKIKPAEELIAQKLHSTLSNLSPNQMLYEFYKYISLIERSPILLALMKERQILISYISQLLKEIDHQIGIEKHVDGKEFEMPGVSPMVQRIQWIKMMEGKISQVQKLIERLLIDLEGSDEALKFANEIKARLLEQQNNLYEDWTRDLQLDIMNKSLVLSSDTPVIEFYGENNFMRVTFNPRLVTLERDVRHMATLGFTIPTNIKEVVNNASKFMEHARSLQQVAGFHNTQGERMIVSQRPMMLNAAVQLASLVKEQTAVPWKDVSSVAKYVEKLTAAVDNLAKQNLYLTSQHATMRNIVMNLIDTNLLQKQNEWKKAIRQMRDIVDRVESNGYTNTKAWLAHWDIQLYKALEHQYRSALIDPLSHLPSMKVELIFRQQGIHLQPPLEEIRASCHSYLKKLISLPLHFVGLQNINVNKESPFASIMFRNNWMIAGAMNEIETTLAKVVEILQRWKKWGALGSVDLDNLCDIHLSHPLDWEKNFKDCKAFGQTIAKLSLDDEHVDWIWISSASLRNDLEIHNRRYWISLTTSLQSSLQQDIATIEGFLLSAHNMMNQNVPKTPKELGEANEEFNTLKEKQTQMITLFEGLRKKQNMVRSWCGERVRSLDGLVKQWENTLSQTQNYEKIIVHQAESVKVNIVGEWSNLCENLEVWFARWLQNKPKPDELTKNTYVELEAKYKLFDETYESWKNFNSEKENLISECKKFNIELEENRLWTKVDKSINEDLSLWEPFQKFSNELNAFGDQEWIIFQKKLHLIDDFVLDWNQKLEPFTPITLFIRNEINTYKEILPNLKNLRGSYFTEKHWREIYSLLEMPTKPANSLVLNDFLNVASNIKRNAKALQKIWSTASHEAVIREAISELELWLAGTRFTLIKHTDGKKQHISIIKDFKDILVKVDEYQNLAGSARAAGDLENGDSIADQLSIWETRLAQMKTILTSLAHVQRKRVLSRTTVPLCLCQRV